MRRIHKKMNRRAIIEIDRNILERLLLLPQDCHIVAVDHQFNLEDRIRVKLEWEKFKPVLKGCLIPTVSYMIVENKYGEFENSAIDDKSKQS
jgi:hypothetical protein